MRWSVLQHAVWFIGATPSGAVAARSKEIRMVNVGSIFESVWAAISELVVGQIVELIRNLLGGLVG